MSLYRNTYLTALIAGLFVSLLVSSGCRRDKERTVPEVSHIPVEVKISRFEQEYAQVTPQTFPRLKEKYPYLFPGSKSDSAWAVFPRDSLWKSLYHAVDSLYHDDSRLREPLKEVFRRVKYYYPAFEAPGVITVISMLDTDYQVIYSDSLLLLSLDTFLGENSVFYARIPGYIRRHFEPSQIPVAVAREIARETAPAVSYRTFIDRMIAAGKLEYATRLFVPGVSEEELFCYTGEKLRWARDNEANIWAYFVAGDMLYDTDKDLARRFIDRAPFSKFYKAFDNESPGRIGVWIGYRIVRSYMEHNDASLPELMATPPGKIFKLSQYKPEK